jgi:transcription initiation factor TFIID subunit 10
MTDFSDKNFQSFYQGLQSNPSIIPDKILEDLLCESGCQCPDIRLKRLIGVAAEKFILDILDDARQLSLIQEKNKVLLGLYYIFSIYK